MHILLCCQNIVIFQVKENGFNFDLVFHTGLSLFTEMSLVVKCDQEKAGNQKYANT